MNILNTSFRNRNIVLYIPKSVINIPKEYPYLNHFLFNYEYSLMDIP